MAVFWNFFDHINFVILPQSALCFRLFFQFGLATDRTFSNYDLKLFIEPVLSFQYLRKLTLCLRSYFVEHEWKFEIWNFELLRRSMFPLPLWRGPWIHEKHRAKTFFHIIALPLEFFLFLKDFVFLCSKTVSKVLYNGIRSAFAVCTVLYEKKSS